MARKVIHLEVEVPESREVVIKLPEEVPVGRWRMVLRIEAPLELPRHDVAWPDGLSLRREDMYGEDGR